MERFHLALGVWDVEATPPSVRGERGIFQPAFFMTVRREIAEPRRETGARRRLQRKCCMPPIPLSS